MDKILVTLTRAEERRDGNVKRSYCVRWDDKEFSLGSEFNGKPERPQDEKSLKLALKLQQQRYGAWESPDDSLWTSSAETEATPEEILFIENTCDKIVSF